MADTVETLRTELDALRAEFNTLKAQAQPVIDNHKPISPPENYGSIAVPQFMLKPYIPNP
jgi:hypothetical protein